MKLKLLLIFLQLMIIGTFFFDGFNYESNNLNIVITGFQALITNEYYIIGNIFLWYILCATIYHSIVLVIGLNSEERYKKLNQSLVAIINIQLLIGLLVVTFLGLFMEITSLLMIGLIVLSTFTKYKFNV